MCSSTPLVESQKISDFGTILFIGNWMAELEKKERKFTRESLCWWNRGRRSVHPEAMMIRLRIIPVPIGTRLCSLPETPLHPSSPIVETRFEIETEIDFNKISSLDSNQNLILAIKSNKNRTRNEFTCRRCWTRRKQWLR
ncbi:hypothetical protein L6452_19740 [Arctium lappa]|uniref:Uncharacterized protein n=1 Tax=Arctium lappa TaxID=4217 RepID=A0ACB9BDT4_ARCLA|nr:hypothetical protein L6452_19740 [Arctium lappa]